METKQKLTIGAIITIAMIVGSGATYYVSQEDVAYHCESKNIVMICEKLSSGTGTRCYFEETYKICKEGWIKLDNEDILSPESVLEDIPEQTKGNKWSCSPEGCIAI